LKGDVLAYMGIVSPMYTKSLSDSITKRQHLDLSKIQIKVSSPPPPTPALPEKAAAQAAPPPPPRESNIGVSMDFSEVMKAQQRFERDSGTSIPLSTLIARAVDMANDMLPLSPNATPTQDDLFHQILGLDSLVPTTSRGSFTPQINTLPAPSAVASPRPKVGPTATSDDITDVLTSTAIRRTPVFGSRTRAARPSTGAAVGTISITVPAGDERRGRLFLGRVKTYLESEPGRLIL
jgi:hypothetical protein